MISNLENAEGSKTFVWTRKKLEEFKKLVERVSKDKKPTDSFIYENHIFVIRYAKYLIEYLEQRLKQ